MLLPLIRFKTVLKADSIFPVACVTLNLLQIKDKRQRNRRKAAVRQGFRKQIFKVANTLVNRFCLTAVD